MGIRHAALFAANENERISSQLNRRQPVHGESVGTWGRGYIDAKAQERTHRTATPALQKLIEVNSLSRALSSREGKDFHVGEQDPVSRHGPFERAMPSTVAFFFCQTRWCVCWRCCCWRWPRGAAAAAVAKRFSHQRKQKSLFQIRRALVSPKTRVHPPISTCKQA